MASNVWPVAAFASCICGAVAAENGHRKRQPWWYIVLTAIGFAAAAFETAVEAEFSGWSWARTMQEWRVAVFTQQLLLWLLEWNIFSVHRKQTARLDGPLPLLLILLGSAICTWSVRGVDEDVVHLGLAIALVVDILFHADPARAHQIEHMRWLWAAAFGLLFASLGIRPVSAAALKPVDEQLAMVLARIMTSLATLFVSMVPRAGHALEEVVFPGLVSFFGRQRRELPSADETLWARSGRVRDSEEETTEIWDHGITGGSTAVFPRQNPGPLPFFHQWPLHETDRPGLPRRCFMQWQRAHVMFSPMAVQRLWHTFVTPVELYLYLWNAAQDVDLLNAVTRLGYEEDADAIVRDHLTSKMTTEMLAQLEARVQQHSARCFSRCMLADNFSMADFLAVCRLQVEYHAVTVSLSEAGQSPWCVAMEAVLQSVIMFGCSPYNGPLVDAIKRTHMLPFQRARGLAIPLLLQWQSSPAGKNDTPDLWIRGAPARRGTSALLRVESKARSGDGSMDALVALLTHATTPSTTQLVRGSVLQEQIHNQQQQLRVVLAFMQERQMYYHMMFRCAYNRYVPLAVFNMHALRPASQLCASERLQKQIDIALRAYRSASVLGVDSAEGDVYVVFQRSLAADTLACARGIMYDSQPELPVSELCVQLLGHATALPAGYVSFLTSLWNAHVHGTFQVFECALQAMRAGDGMSLSRAFLTVSQNVVAAAFKHLDTAVVWGWQWGCPVPLWIANMDIRDKNEQARVHVLAVSYMISMYTGHAMRSLVEMHLGPAQTPAPADAHLQVGQGLETPLFQCNPWSDVVASVE